MKTSTLFSASGNLVRGILIVCFVVIADTLPAQTSYTNYLYASFAGTASDLSISVGNNDDFVIHGELGVATPGTWRERYAFYLDSAGTLQQARRWINNPTPNSMSFSDVCRLPGGYLDGLLFSSGGGIFQEILAVKTNAAGTIQWSNFYAPDTTHRFLNPTYVKRLQDNTYVLGTSIRSNVPGQFAHYFAMRLDSTGNLLWAKGYRNQPFKFPHVCMDVTQDDNILIGGYSHNNSLSAQVADVVRVDKNGNLLWAKQYKYTQFLGGRSLHEAQGDSIWLVSDYIAAMQPGGSGPAVLKLDSAGQVAWGRRYFQGVFELYPDGSLPVRDSGLVIFGSTNTNPASSFLLKIDARGNQQWFYTITDIAISDIAERSNGNLFYTGVDFNTYPSIKYGELVPGSPTVCATLQPPLMDSAFTPLVYPDTGQVVIPMTRAEGLHYADTIPGTQNTYCDALTGNQPEPGVTNPLSIAPNPASETVRISGLQGQNTIRMYNSRGQLCMSQVTQNDTQWLDVSQFAEGLYFIMIDNGEKRSAQKLVIQR